MRIANYTSERNAIEAPDAAFEELKAGGVLLSARKSEIRGARAKLKDVIYTLTASPSFVAEKAANKRQFQAEAKLSAIVGNSKAAKNQ